MTAIPIRFNKDHTFNVGGHACTVNFFHLLTSYHFKFTVLYNTMSLNREVDSEAKGKVEGEVREKCLSFTVVAVSTCFIYDDGYNFEEPLFYDVNIPLDKLDDLAAVLLARINNDPRYYMSHDNRASFPIDEYCMAVCEVKDLGNDKINVSCYTPYRHFCDVSKKENPRLYYYSILQVYFSKLREMEEFYKEFGTSHKVFMQRLQHPIDDYVFPRIFNENEYVEAFIRRITGVLKLNYKKYKFFVPFDTQKIKPKGFFPNWTGSGPFLYAEIVSYPRPSEKFALTDED